MIARLISCLLLTISFYNINRESELTSRVRFIEIEHIEVQDALFSVAWNPIDSNQLMMSGQHGVYLYDLLSDRLSNPDFTEDFTVSSVWNSDGSIAASLLADGQVYIWDVNDLSVIDIWQSHTHMSTDIAWSPDDSKIAVGSWDNTVTIYSVEQQRQIAALSEDRNGEILSNVGSLDWNPDSNRLLFSTARSFIVWDVGSNEQLLQVHSNRTSGKIASWSPNGQLMAFGGVIPADWDIPAQGAIYLWQTDAVRPLQTILIADYGDLWFYSFAWHPNDIWLASYNDDQQIRIWDTSTGELITQLQGEERFGLADIPSYNSLAWSTDGTMLADAGSNGGVNIWAIDT